MRLISNTPYSTALYNSFQYSRAASERQKPKHGVTYAKKKKIFLGES